MRNIPREIPLDLAGGDEKLEEIIKAQNEINRATADNFANGLIISESTVSQFQTMVVGVPAADSTSSPYPIGFGWLFPRTPPRFCLVVDARDAISGRTVLSSLGTPDWSYSNGVVVINGLNANLTPERNYNFTFWAFA